MIICPQCGNNELPGALYCRECGTQFTSINRDPTLTFTPSISVELKDNVMTDEDLPVPPTPDNARLSLFLVDTGEVIPLEGLNEYTLGRSAEDQPILPDVDLAPYHAYENGVSRLHASIKISTPHAFLTDFGSANGTQLNGIKIPPNKPHPISHGDIFVLGELKLQLLVNRQG